MADDDNVRIIDPVPKLSGDVAISLNKDEASNEKTKEDITEKREFENKSLKEKASNEKSTEKKKMSNILEEKLRELVSDENILENKIDKEDISELKISDCVVKEDRKLNDISDSATSERPQENTDSCYRTIIIQSCKVDAEESKSSLNIVFSSENNTDKNTTIETAETEDLEQKGDSDVASLVPSTSTNVAETESVPEKVKKKSALKKMANFLTLGLARNSIPTHKSQRKTVEKTASSESSSCSAQVVAAEGKDEADNPSASATLPHLERRLFSGTRFKFGLMPPKIKLRDNDEEQRVNWLGTYERHLFPVHEPQTNDLTVPESDNKESSPKCSTSIQSQEETSKV